MRMNPGTVGEGILCHDGETSGRHHPSSSRIVTGENEEEIEHHLLHLKEKGGIGEELGIRKDQRQRARIRQETVTRSRSVNQ